MSDPQPLVLSASSAKLYLDCGYRYLREHVWREPAPPNLDMAIGTAVHAGVEALHKGRASRSLKTTENSLVKEMATVRDFEGVTPATAMNQAGKMLAVYREKVLPSFHPTMVEKRFLMKVNGVLVSGQIDAADEEDVHDTKTTKALSGFNVAWHRFQMTCYRWGYKTLTGRLPKRLVLDVIARNGNWKSVVVEPDDNEFTDVLGVVRDGIMKGAFEPTGAFNGSCRRCPFLEDCAYARVD